MINQKLTSITLLYQWVLETYGLLIQLGIWGQTG
jgi:hypothetical protein